MSAKIIDPDRYKKTTRKMANKNKEKIKRKEKLNEIINKKVYKNKLTNNNSNNNINYNKEFEYTFLNDKLNQVKKSPYKKDKKKIKKISKKNYEKKNKTSYNKYSNKPNKLINIQKTVISFIAVFLLIVIGITSKVIVNSENNKDITVSSNQEEKVDLVQNYDFIIGMNKLDTTDIYKTQNIVYNELIKLSNNSLIKINKDYSFEYKVAKKIEKINDKEYFIEINPEYNITLDEIFKTIEKFKNTKENMYFDFVNNIQDMTKQGNTEFLVKLKNDDNTFIYNLDFPIIESEKKSSYTLKNDSNNIILNKNNSKSTLNTIKMKGYSDSDDLIDDFRNYKIDMFTTSSDSLTKLIGKHEYNVKKYRDGQTLFLLGNKDSELFKRNEVRKALAYSLNRDEIIKEINPLFMEVIDIPYIYSDVKIKYDIYGAENVLQTQGWQKSSGLYRLKEKDKTINLELNLLVNEEDLVKVKVADKIKEMAEKVGIKINILKLKNDAFKEGLNNKKYDIVLADLYINNIPNLEFLNDYLNINNEINSAIKIFNESNTENISKNLITLQNLLSSEVACIGIFARDTNIVYQKNITGFDDLKYMKIFDNIEKIGKKQSINNEKK